MKKTVAWLLVLTVVMLFACAAFAESVTVGEERTYQPSEIDLNLYGMSGTIVYSQIHNIMTDPYAWLGKVLRIAGYYSVWQDPQTGTVYHSCIIPDATACCAQGMEFVWGGNHNYPEDYPEYGTPMVVTGLLESYMEGEYMYLHLTDAEVEWLVDGQ